MAAVLLVEDDAEVAEMLGEVLESLGHTVSHAGSGAAALAAIAKGPLPDVVITDMIMPGGISGLDLVRALRASSPGLPVVLATGHDDRAAEFRAAGLPVLQKPFGRAELQAALRAARSCGA